MGLGGYGGYGYPGYGYGVGAWGMGSAMYGWGLSEYNNAYYGLPQMSAGQLAAPTQARIADRDDVGQPTGGNSGQLPGPTQARIADRYDLSQPISTTAAAPAAPVAAKASASFNQARDAFRQGNYTQAVRLDQQALEQMPNDPSLHEFLALGQFAQGKYDQAASTLYAVLSVGPGWNWTSLIGMYPEADVYTRQLRALEAYSKANPQSAPAHFVLGYHYLTQGHDEAAVKQFEQAARLKPADKLSAQLVAQYHSSEARPPSAAEATSLPGNTAAAPATQGKLPGSWVASPAKDFRVTLTIKDDGHFTWDASGSGRARKSIAGTSTIADGILTLTGQGGQDGALVGKVDWQDAEHFTFRLVGAPSNDPGLKFAR